MERARANSAETWWYRGTDQASYFVTIARPGSGWQFIKVSREEVEIDRSETWLPRFATWRTLRFRDLRFRGPKDAGEEQLKGASVDAATDTEN